MMADTMTLEEAMNWLDYAHRKGEHSGGGVGGGLADAIDVVMTFVNETQGATVPHAALENDREEVTVLRKRLAELEAREAVGRISVVTEEMIRAAACSVARDDEGQFPALTDLIDFSGENKTRTVIKKALEDALAAAPPAPSAWRPISEAPTDGTVVLLYCPQGDGNPGSTYRMTCGNWASYPGGIRENRDLEGRWMGQDESEGWEGWESWDGGFSEDTMMPTLWQPLPAPPPVAEKAPEGAEGGR